MQQIWYIHKLHDIQSHTYRGSMPIYVPNMKLLPLMMKPEALYTDDNDDGDDNVTAKLHIPRWPKESKTSTTS